MTAVECAAALGSATVRQAWLRAAALLLTAAGSTMGCGGGDGPTGPTGTVPSQLVKSAGDLQTGFLSNPLPTAYRVLVLDSAGAPVPGVIVTWTVTTGDGTVAPPQGTTGADGAAEATHTLGPSAVSQSVTASIPGPAPVTFTASGVAAPTAVSVTVGNDFFSPRNVVVRQGGAVTWTWATSASIHNVTYTAGPAPLPSSSATKDTGTHSNTFTVLARYDYACTLHAGMEGSVTVVK
ncbi:MAG: hypothetical protein FJ207_08120 [Gemmatimonadetes bacterium]|nr:hypothetical protein [Gemmatimonadota bacterium]